MVRHKLKLLVPFKFDSSEVFGDVRGLDVVEVDCKGSEEALFRAMRGVDILLGDVGISATKSVIDAGDKLKAIVCISQGVDFVDLNAATEKGVFVTNSPEFAVVAVAEHALALMLAIARKVVAGHVAAVSENWSIAHNSLEGVELQGKTLGIIGIGKIGRCLASKAKGLGMDVIAYHPHPNTKENVARELGIYITDALEILLKDSDIVAIHVPLTDSTKRMIGESQLKMMKKSAFIVNCSRGSVLEENALIKALREGWIAGAALDVLENEPPNKDNPLLSLKNTLITPHIAWNTKEAKKRAREEIKREVTRIVNGKVPKNLVNKEVLQRFNLT